MVALSSPGISSGLDVKSIVTALVQAEITPAKNRLDKEEANLTTKLSSLGQIKSALAKLQTTMGKLTNKDSFSSFSAEVSDPSLLQANVTGTNLTKANYQIQIQKLASSQSLASSPFTDSTSSIGQGSLTIEFGTYSSDKSSFTTNPDLASLTINIASGQDSLTAIKDAINNANSSVTAAIVQDKSGTRLTLISKETGTSASMKITVNDNDTNNSDNTGLSALAFDPTVSISNLTETTAAIDSEVLVNGLLITESSNHLSNVIEGVDLNLLKASPGDIIQLSMDTSTSQATALVNEFVKQYNETLNTINSLTSYNQSTKSTGSLQSDSAIRNLKFQLGSLIVNPIKSAEGPFKSLADIGIKISNNQGMLTLDTEVFNEALTNNFDSLVSLLADTSSTDQSSTTVEGIASTFKDLLSPYLSSGGELATKTNQINDNLKTIDKNRDDLSLRVSNLTDRYTKQFTALDSLLSQMQSTSQFLTQQLANLPQLTTKRN